MKKLRLREMKYLVQGHTAHEVAQLGLKDRSMSLRSSRQCHYKALPPGNPHKSEGSEDSKNNATPKELTI